MGAAAYVGRIGGLAVALGVGAAVFTGHGVAWADPSTSGADSTSSGSTGGSGSASPSGGSPDGSSGTPSKSTPASSKVTSSTPPDDADTSGTAHTASGTTTLDASGTDKSSATTASNSPADTGVPVTSDGGGDAPAPTATSRHSGDRPNASRPSSDTARRTLERRPPEQAQTPSAVSTKTRSYTASTPADAPAAEPAQKTLLAASSTTARTAVATAPAPAQLPAPTSTPSTLADVVSIGISNLFASLADSFSGDTPATPADPPAAWTLLAATRRETFGTSPSLDKLVAPATTGLSVDNADTPQQALTLAAAAVPSPFVAPPAVAIPQTAPLEGLQRLPVLGALVFTPIVTIIHQIPLIGDVLHPYLGYPLQLGLSAATPVPRDVKVVSFDGTQIYVHFIPASGLAPGKTAPTILDGPGLGLPGSTAYLTEKDEFLPNDVIGVGALRDAGYNVVTWDPRGEWSSGGQLEVDSPDFEARDMSAIISWLATQPEVQLDPGVLDPRIGMVGASYGGGIQLVTAAIDPRVDAIVPTIAWNSLNTSLYKNQSFKTGWGTLLVAALAGTGARPNPALYPAAVYGALTGLVTPENQDLLAARGPGDLINQITAPTLLIQGTVDTLFTLNEADANATALIGNGVDTKVIWFCGGHGSCVSSVNDGVLVQQRTLDWLARYVKGDASVDTGAQFEWVDQHGTQFSSDTYPVVHGTPLVATGSTGGVLPLVPVIGGSGPQPGVLLTGPIGALLGLPSGAAAANSVSLKTPEATTTTYIVGAPELTFTYSGVGTGSHVYAQLVDDTSGLVLGNLVTPVAVTLDGQTHVVTVQMEQVAQTLKPGETVTLQIVSSAVPYQNVTSFGALNVSSIQLTLPTVDPSAITFTQR